MSGGTDRLARKIRSAKDLSSVVRSMKALAASSIGQYERAVESLQDYTRSVNLALGVCLRQGTPTAVLPARIRPAGIVIFGSDQGLVGRFNEILMECVVDTLKVLGIPVGRVWTMGAPLALLVADAGLPQTSQLVVPNCVEMITPAVGELLVTIEGARSTGSANAIYLFHNEPLAAGHYRPTHTRLLPLDDTWAKDLRLLPWPTKACPQVIDGATSAIPALTRNHLFAVLFQACAQSLASENASRLAAMQRAEENISARVMSLTGEFHRLRQATIDEELFEVISGCEALGKRVRP